MHMEISGCNFVCYPRFMIIDYETKDINQPTTNNNSMDYIIILKFGNIISFKSNFILLFII